LLRWLEHLVSSIGRHIPSPIRTLIHLATGGLAALVDLVFGNVDGAWEELAKAGQGLEHFISKHADAIYAALRRIITYDIPHFAMTAWWWTTHPHQLADQLYWHIVYWLEQRAWSTGQYLGEFALSLLMHNARRFIHALEVIVAAVL
jgi:hypothetical protein